MEKTRFKHLCLSAIFVMAIAMSANGAVFATETATGEGAASKAVPINGTIEPLTITVTHPAVIAWAVNPNNIPNYAAPDFSVVNNSKSGIKVTIKSLRAATTNTLGVSEVLKTDVGPSDKVFSSLNAADTERFIALAVRAKTSEGGWGANTVSALQWAVNVNNTLIGTLPAGAIGKMTMCIYHGTAVAREFIAVHNLVFSFSLE